MNTKDILPFLLIAVLLVVILRREAQKSPATATPAEPLQHPTIPAIASQTVTMKNNFLCNVLPARRAAASGKIPTLPFKTLTLATPPKTPALKVTTTCAATKKWVNPVAGCSSFGKPIDPRAITHVSGNAVMCNKPICINIGNPFIHSVCSVPMPLPLPKTAPPNINPLPKLICVHGTAYCCAMDAASAGGCGPSQRCLTASGECVQQIDIGAAMFGGGV